MYLPEHLSTLEPCSLKKHTHGFLAGYVRPPSGSSLNKKGRMGSNQWAEDDRQAQELSKKAAVGLMLAPDALPLDLIAPQAAKQHTS